MVGFFPMLYEDELLYSGIARYHIRSGNVSIKATTKDLFGSSTASSVVELPSNIDAFIRNLPKGTEYTFDEIIEKHSMLPLYAVFISEEKSHMIKQSMRSNNGGDIYNRIGLMATTIENNSFLKFCPKCFEEDMNRLGESYWHRIHQASGVFVCTKHKTLLVDSTVRFRTQNKHEFVCATEENCLKENNNIYLDSKLIDDDSAHTLKKILLSKGMYEKLDILAKNVELLLNKKYTRESPLSIWQKYNNGLKKIDLANVNGQIDQKQLISSFIAYYGNDFLSILQSQIDINNNNNWLTQIVRKPRKTFHPIRHLLVIQFLGITLDEFFIETKENPPFGEGPWYCLNASADHYLERVIDNVIISYDSKAKKPIGTFTCKCGFVYSRRGPDKHEEDRLKIGKIKCYGSIWEEKLKGLAEERLSLREIARRMRVDTKTIDKYAMKLKVNRYWEKAMRNDENSIESVEGAEDKGKDERKLIEHHRNEWSKLVKGNPTMNKTELRRLNGGLYAWLYKNDRENFIQQRTNCKCKCIIKNRIDWKKRDEEVLDEVQKTINCLLESSRKPNRITIGKVGKEIGKLALLQKQLDKLPLTRKYFESHVEDLKSFQKRRIEWAISELEEGGEEVKEWKVMRKAGIKSINNDMREYIENLIYDEVKK